ncbi:phage tail assembly chaperone [Sphingomonas oryzagri]|uniref:Phage tail assembly chaperone n=1 Tax=Sphingomonas oryzagri TaxID=3042314 RepID=A0ABT6N2R3_9SPHN|nr:phage tail assembly chaperone [Sphingomonas oryzagri]MDH7639578.1 phage tail assembly chaperone [Sphingomonas oryzagri]
MERAVRLAGIAGALAGWRPDEFWRATPAELEAVLSALSGPQAQGDAPPDAVTIAALKEQFPDG